MDNFIDFGAIGEAADLLIEDIRLEMENQNINAKGNLSDSLGWQITASQHGLSLSVTADGYWDYAIGGRGPGNIPGNFVEKLEDWIRDKGIPFSGDISSFAGAIAYNIKNYGSSRFRTGNKADVVSGPVERFLERVSGAVKPDIEI